jgi:hypothetical protein
MTRVILWMVCIGLLAGCGYGQKELYEPNVGSISVPIFKNQSFHRELEFKMTASLKKRIESRTPYKVTASGVADTLLSGTIVSVETTSLSRDFDSGLVQEAQLSVTVDVEWKDLRDGRIIRKRRAVTGTGRYVPTRGVGEPVEVAYHQAVEDVSWQILAMMQQDW